MSRNGDPGVGCELVRPLLAELAEGTLHEAGPVEEHIAGCAACLSEFSSFRMLVLALGELRDVQVEPSLGFVDRVLEGVGSETRRIRPLHRVTSAASSHRVALSVGGAAVVGVTAVGLLWWRTARRGVSSPAGAAASVLASS